MHASRRSPLTDAVAAGARNSYERRRDLPRILPVWPHEIEDLSVAAHRALVNRLQRALRAERQRGIAGCWTYDLARHANLARALRTELALLTARHQLAAYDVPPGTPSATLTGSHS